MFEKVLLATDFSPGAAKLIECLKELETVGTKDLTLLWAVDLNSAGGYSTTLQKHHLEKLEGKKEELQSLGFRVKYEAPIGFPANEIVNAAHDNDCDLIVIGSRGKNLLRDLWLGSTVSDVIRINTIPTLVERIELKKHLDQVSCKLVCARKFKSILFPTDFSQPAGEAEKTALELASHAEKLVIISVIDEGENEEDIAKIKLQVKEKMEALSDKCEQACANVVVKVEKGIASKNINRIAEEEDITLIIMGTKGNGRLQSNKLGSTAETVTRQANRPVLLIPSRQS